MTSLWFALSCAVIGFFWCCCRRTNCRIGSDNFDRADEDPVNATKWTEVAGSDWAVVSNTLRTSTSDALLKFNTAHPRSVSDSQVRVDIYGGSDADEFIVGLAYADASNYYFARFVIGNSGCISIWKRIGGVSTKLSQRWAYLPAATTHSVLIQYSDGKFFAQVNGGSNLEAFGPSIGTYAVLGTGTIGGQCRFDNFIYTRGHTSHTKDPDDDTDVDETRCPALGEDCGITGLAAVQPDGALSCTWSAAAGSWSVASNVMLTSSTSAIAVCQIGHPRESGAFTATVDVVRNSSGDKARLIVGCNSSGVGGYAAEIKLAGAGSELKLFDPAGTLMGTKSGTLSNSATISLCLADNQVTAICGSMILEEPATIPTVRSYIAVGTGGTVGGAISFSNVVIFRAHSSDDTRCGTCSSACDGFTAGTKQFYYNAIFENVAPPAVYPPAAGENYCHDCTGFNGTWELALATVDHPYSPGDDIAAYFCVYYSDLGPPCSTQDRGQLGANCVDIITPQAAIHAVIQYESPTVKVRSRLETCGHSGSGFTKRYGNPALFPTQKFSSHDGRTATITLPSNSFFGVDLECDISAATCTLEPGG